jgi:hypothetical protein
LSSVNILLFLFCFQWWSSCSFIVKNQFENYSEHRNNYQKKKFKLHKLFKLIKEGDIILRNGEGKESDIIRKFATRDSTYTHVGILLRDKFGFYKVTHILGGVSNPNGSILQETINDFINEKENKGFAVYRFKISKSQTNKFKRYVDSLIRQKVTFDYKFSLESQDSLYCTEFIVNGFNYVISAGKIFKPVTKDISTLPARYFLNRDTLIYYPIDIFSSSIYFKKIISEKYK